MSGRVEHGDCLEVMSRLLDEGMQALLIEQDADYVADICRRLNVSPDAVVRPRAVRHDDLGPLFGTAAA